MQDVLHIQQGGGSSFLIRNAALLAWCGFGAGIILLLIALIFVVESRRKKLQSFICSDISNMLVPVNLMSLLTLNNLPGVKKSTRARVENALKQDGPELQPQTSRNIAFD